MSSIDDLKRTLEISSDIFEDRLRHFVRRWGPKDLRDMHDFQMDMTRLMVDAMRHKSHSMTLGTEIYASQIYSEVAMRPLLAIFEASKKS